MFLPVLLVRDYGVLGWVAFAAPNVAGAAAMGWVLHDAAASRRLVLRHAAACQWFSVVTLAFQAFFYAWVVRWVTGSALPPYGRWAAAYLAMVAVVLLLRRGVWIGAGATYAVSVAAITVLLHRQLIPHLPAATGSPRELLFLAPVCAFGFGLCPYLDLTFHEARQSTTPAAGRVAFGVGFGVFFVVMIAFTLAYSGYLVRPGSALPELLAAPLGLHLLAQVILKLVLHGLAALPRREPVGMGRAAVLLLSVGAAAGLGTFCRLTPVAYHGLSAGEVVYRCFMAFYGLLFPAYVWICVIGAGDEPQAMAVARRWVWAGAVVTATPMFWLGFIEQRTVWLVPGLAVVLLAKLAVKRKNADVFATPLSAHPPHGTEPSGSAAGHSRER